MRYFAKDEIIKLHLDLSLYHAQEARSAALDIVHQHHQELSELLAYEAKRISDRASDAIELGANERRVK